MSSAGRQYDAWAYVYDLVWRRYSERTVNELLTRAEFVGTRVLDVGCGTGILEEKLVQRHPEWTIVGIDASSRMIQRARAKRVSSNLSFVQASADELPFPDAAFDTVLSASALHYLEHPVASLREMRRVLIPGGRLNVLDWSLDFKLMRLREAVLRRIDPAHHRAYTGKQVRGLFHEAGLTIQGLDTFRSSTYGLFIVRATPAG